MKVYEGPGLVAMHAKAPILPVRIDGAQFSKFSRLGKRLHTRWFPRITLTILPPRHIEPPEGVTGRRRREIVGAMLYDLMTEMVFETSHYRQTMFEALLEARGKYGRRSEMVEDMERKPLSYDRLVMGSFILGGKIAAMTRAGERVGVLLPNANAMAVTFFALQAYGRVPVHLNFSAGAGNLLSACETAQLQIVLTSRRFIEEGELQPLIDAIGRKAEIVWLEDVKAGMGLADKLTAWLKLRAPRFFYRRAAGSPAPESPAVMLFTSGSEGAPKGVVLSHVNLNANRLQIISRIDFTSEDCMFNALPLFHSFGLTGAFLMPLLSGVRVFLYPSPLHYRIVPVMVYETDATVLVGTDTFLAGYARMAHPYDFYSVRYVVAGAEKVREETRRQWAEKFGIRILEGYGVTETSPVLAVNTPMHYRTGAVGRFLPSIRHRLEKVPGVGRGGRLFVAGPNVMLGYMLADEPGRLQPLADGWYDTGDIVDVDDDGFVTILGRAKRFAKIAGEMVSLTAVEAHVSAIWPGEAHAVIAAPDARKGERLVLATERAGADRAALLAAAQKAGLSELMIPRDIIHMEELPVMGTGKLDYVAIGKMVFIHLGINSEGKRQ
jgi:acyl-[acyl-carrier-protein]-phospholipid O-acyltransferase/long-chain-fatty-acid--[acyl-carrier-protein] ligase